MERLADDFDSAKRAKEIYSRKNGINIEDNRKKYFSIYKFLFQLLVLINITISFMLFKNKDNIFSKEFINCVNDFFYINITERFNNFFKEEEKINTEIQNITVVNKSLDNNTNNTIENSNEVKNEISKIDILKSDYNFLKPLNGTITSKYGNRESSNPNVSGFHTGIDISAEKGTIINSAISGDVIQVSNEGNYGNHLQIRNNDVTTLYAHCNKVFVKEGDKIKGGQKIAEVGDTGNSTGPHLHFEIKYKDDFIDPMEIIEF